MSELFSETREAFDPSKYLRKIQGNDYLEVKWRLVWLRDVFPDAVVETEHIRLDDLQAIMRCRIELPTGAVATGYGACRPEEFRDYIEKAETSAQGRALAVLGFGTQFTGDASEKLVDSPVEGGRGQGQGRGQGRQPTARVTSDDIGRIRYHARETKMSEAQLLTETARTFEVRRLEDLTLAQADALIEWIKSGVATLDNVATP